MRSLALASMLEPPRARPLCMASYARPLARRWGARRHPHPRSTAAAAPPCLGMKITGTSKEEAFGGVVLDLFVPCMSSITLWPYRERGARPPNLVLGLLAFFMSSVGEDGAWPLRELGPYGCSASWPELDLHGSSPLWPVLGHCGQRGAKGALAPP
ncbi:hypothetical protein Dimus_001149 [Dionaea muscipula]